MKQIIWTTTNFIAPVMVIFLLFLAFFLYPRTFQGVGNVSIAGSICADPPPGYPTIQAPEYFITSYYQVDGEGNNGGFVDSVLLGPQKTYKMIKANVPFQEVGENWFHFINSDVFVKTPGGKRQVIWPTGISGKYLMVNNQEVATDVLFMDHGIIFLQHLDMQDKPKELTINGKKIPIVDIYKQVDKPEVRPNAFLCTEEANIENADAYTSYFSRVVIPEQNPSKDNQQLQLEYFVFDKPKLKILYLSSGCKPAVYLYPPSKQMVNVKVFPKGFLTYTDPLYDSKRGWTVDAYPDGTITTTYNLQPTNYPYLYYESKIADEAIPKPTKGWVLKYDELSSLYQQILPKLGLDAKQSQDFIDYWTKALPESPYYFVGIINQADVDQFEPLEITPKPDYINRVRIYFERLDSPKVVEAPELSAISHQLSAESGQPKADGRFTVVEWGGMVKNDPNHPFTCSQ